MTLVYDRGALPAGKSVTHALVIGCGRFPADDQLDHPATVAGARAMTDLFATLADQFVAPVWTIRCLLSEMGVAPGQDRVGVTLADPGNGAVVAHPNATVDAATLANVIAEFKAWKAALKARPGDSALLYVSSHGVADPASRLALLEDIFTDGDDDWDAMLNVTTTSGGLPKLDIERGWVFLDACQDIVQDRIGAHAGMLTGHHPFPYTAMQASFARRTVAIVGSHLGEQGWAPTNGDPSFFTQTLIEGLKTALVEPVNDLGWTVTGKQLIWGLPELAQVLGLDANCEPITAFNQANVGLLKVGDPKTHVAIATEVEVDLEPATVTATCSEAGIGPEIKLGGAAGVVWRFSVEAHKTRSYKVEAECAGGAPVYHPDRFDAMPPAQSLTLKRAP